MTYNNMVEMFRRFTDNHYFLKTFVHGEQPEMTNEKLEEYPLLFLLYTGSQYADGTETFNFEVYILDLPLNKENRLENQTEVVSDCKQVAEDILADIKLGGQIFTFPDLVDVVNASILPAIDTTTNLLSGVVLSLSIDIPYTSDSCFAPLTGVVPTPFGQDIVNTDGVLIKNFTNFQPVAVLDDIEVQDVIGIFGTFPQPTRIVVNGSTIDLVGVHPTTGEMIIDTICPAADPATYRNSDNSFNQLIASGATFISDDITIEDVDGTQRTIPSNVNGVCEWKNLQIFNSAGTNLSPLITSYPAGGQIIYADILIREQSIPIGTVPAGNRINIVNADIGSFSTGGSNIAITLTLIDILNSDGLILLSPADLIGNKTIPDVDLTDDDGAVGSYPIPTTINIDGEVTSASYAAGTLKITPAGGAAPSGIAYKAVAPMSMLPITTGVNDSRALFISGFYDRVNPVFPVSYAEIDSAATQADVRVTPATGTLSTDSIIHTILKHNNAFGNKLRFTDSLGNASDATVGSDRYAHVNWLGHSFGGGAIDYYVIDHLTGDGYMIKYVVDSGDYNMTTTVGKNWADWMTAIASLNLGGFTDWQPLDCCSLRPHINKANVFETWANNFFITSRAAGEIAGQTDNRVSFVTGENANTLNFNALFDSGNVSTIFPSAKATSGGFSQVISNVFPIRRHYT